MDIAGLSTALSGANTQNQVSTAVLGKSLDTNDAMGQGLVEMIDSAAMERSVNPNIGANLDMSI